MKHKVMTLALTTMVCAAPAGAALAQGQPAIEERVLRNIDMAYRECRDDLRLMEPYTVANKEYWKATPGSYKSFAVLKFLHLMFSSGRIDAITAAPVVYLRFNGGSGTQNCKELDARIQRMRAPIKPGATCHLVDQIATCMAKMDSIHRSHFGKKNLYRKEYISSLGVYEWALSYERNYTPSAR